MPVCNVYTKKALSMSFNFFGLLTVLWVMQTQAEQIHFIKDIPCYEEATSSSEKCNQCFNFTNPKLHQGKFYYFSQCGKAYQLHLKSFLLFYVHLLEVPRFFAI